MNSWKKSVTFRTTRVLITHCNSQPKHSSLIASLSFPFLGPELDHRKDEIRTFTTGKQHFAVYNKNTANAFGNTAKALPCFDTRQNIHGIDRHGKDICLVYF
jgi:hypothetical protein